MTFIYEPKGKALEYSPLACNLFTGCEYKCRYCYVPGVMRKTYDEWHQRPTVVRRDAVALFERDAKKLAGDPREILLCFTSDPYQNAECAAVTRQVLEIAERYELRMQVLTKAGNRARDDFDLLERNGWKFGTTICFLDEGLRQQWEPGAPSIASRIEALIDAHALGIHTWVSLEPVVDADQAIEVIRLLRAGISSWKVGKLNHFAEIEAKIDWRAFLRRVRGELDGCDYYIKQDLLKYE